MSRNVKYLLSQIIKNHRLGNKHTVEMYIDSLVGRIGLLQTRQLLKNL